MSTMKTTARILVVDDEQAIADLVVTLLEQEGFEAHACYSGPQALEELRNAYDLAILDVMMPGVDGFEVCRQVRRFSNMGIIFLSAKDEEIDKVLGLTIGGDDFATKPFKPRELMARVKACLRRNAATPTPPTHIVVRGIAIDPTSHEASLHSEPLSLTPKEFGVLSLLVKEAGKPVSSQRIFETVWAAPYAASSSNSVMVCIRHLRQKLAAIDGSEQLIETVWGVGYRIPHDRSTQGAQR